MSAIANWSSLATLLSGVFDQASSMSTTLVGLGKTMLAIAFLLPLLSALLAFWVKGGAQDFLASTIRLLLVASIPLAALASWQSTASTLSNFFQQEIPSALGYGGGTDVVKTEVASLLNAANSVGSSTDSGTGTSDATTATTNADPIFAGDPLITLPANDGNAQTPPKTAPSAASSIFDLGGLLTNLFLRALSIFLIDLPALILSLAAMLTIYGTLLMMSIGIIFGPILIAWLPWEPLSSLATNWLKYMLSAGMGFAVAIVFLKLSNNMIAGLASNMQSLHSMQGATLAGAIQQMFVTGLGLLFLAFMVFKAEHLGAALIGGPHIGGGGFLAGAAMGGALRAMRGGGKKNNGDKEGGSNQSAGGAPGGGSGGSGGGGAAGAGGAASSSSANLSNQAGAVSATNVSGAAGAAVAAGGAMAGNTAAGAAGAGSFGSTAKAVGGAAAKDGSKALGKAAVKTALAAGAIAGGPATAAAVVGGAVSMKAGRKYLKNVHTRLQQGGAAPSATQSGSAAAPVSLPKTGQGAKVNQPAANDGEANS